MATTTVAADLDDALRDGKTKFEGCAIDPLSKGLVSDLSGYPAAIADKELPCATITWAWTANEGIKAFDPVDQAMDKKEIKAR